MPGKKKKKKYTGGAPDMKRLSSRRKKRKKWNHAEGKKNRVKAKNVREIWQGGKNHGPTSEKRPSTWKEMWPRDGL